MSVAGRHAVVTGGGRGIGLAIASRLAGEGARVSIVSRTAQCHPERRRVAPQSKGEQTTDFFCAKADVADEGQVRAAFAACRDENGPIAILVNNAGIAESAPLSRTGLEMWGRIIATNLTGTFLCTREVIDAMVAAGWGRIVNVASTAGLDGAPYISAYCASKHGVVGFTRAIAEELGSTGVTVNAVCPGYTETAIMQAAIANIMAKSPRTEKETRELMARGNPQGRIATPNEVAHEVFELIDGSRTGIVSIVPSRAVPAQVRPDH